MSRGEHNRVLYRAILASLVLHALLLFGLPEELISSAQHAASLPPKIIARLMAPEPVPEPSPRSGAGLTGPTTALARLRVGSAT